MAFVVQQFVATPENDLVPIKGQLKEQATKGIDNCF